MDGLVIGNQIQCYSPAAKEVPRIITENGEQSPEAKLGGKSFLLLPGPRELRTDAGDWGGGSTQEGRVGGEEGGMSLGMSEKPRGILGESLGWQGHV